MDWGYDVHLRDGTTFFGTHGDTVTFRLFNDTTADLTGELRTVAVADIARIDIS